MECCKSLQLHFSLNCSQKVDWTVRVLGHSKELLIVHSITLYASNFDDLAIVQ